MSCEKVVAVTYDTLAAARIRSGTDGVRYGIEEVAKRIPTAKGKKPEDFVNLKFLHELEKEGFFKELSK
jgi:hypothetical protein